MTYWYRVEIYKRNTDLGRDDFSNVRFIKTDRKLTRVVEVLSSKNHNYGLFVTMITPQGDGVDLVGVVDVPDMYILCEWDRWVSSRGEKAALGYKKLEYVEIAKDQLNEWVKMWKREIECDEELRRIEHEMDLLSAQKRKVLADKRENSKKRFRVIQDRLC